MKWNKWLCAALFVTVALHGVALAAEGPLPFQILNRLRIEYDDNIRQAPEDEDSSLKIIEEVELHLNMKFEQSFVGLRYRPSFVYWDDRDEDDTDFHHDIDFVLNHRFTPRLSLGIKDTFRLTELPEAIERAVVVREKNDFIYNTLNSTLSVLGRPDLRFDVSGRYVVLQYDEDNVAEQDDYELTVLGVSARHQIVPETAIAGDVRYEDITYENESRDSSTIQVGGAVEHTFSPNLLGSIRAGYHQKEFDDAGIDEQSQPYADVSLTVLPSPLTRITAGAGYSFFEANVSPWANQTRTRVFLNFAHDMTAKVSLYLSSVYTKGEYDPEQLPRDTTIGDLPLPLRQDVPEEFLDTVIPEEMIQDAPDQEEDIFQLSARMTYKINRMHWLEAGWQFTDADSDLRDDFQRNRVHVGWKVKL